MSEKGAKSIIFNLVSDENVIFKFRHQPTLPCRLMIVVLPIEMWQPYLVCFCLLNGFEIAVTFGLIVGLIDSGSIKQLLRGVRI